MSSDVETITNKDWEPPSSMKDFVERKRYLSSTMRLLGGEDWNRLEESIDTESALWKRTFRPQRQKEWEDARPKKEEDRCHKAKLRCFAILVSAARELRDSTEEHNPYSRSEYRSAILYDAIGKSKDFGNEIWHPQSDESEPGANASRSGLEREEDQLLLFRSWGLLAERSWADLCIKLKQNERLRALLKGPGGLLLEEVDDLGSLALGDEIGHASKARAKLHESFVKIAKSLVKEDKQAWGLNTG
jgi:hypothetical protein